MSDMIADLGSMGLKITLSFAAMLLISEVFMPIVYKYLEFGFTLIFGDGASYNSLTAFFFHLVVFLFSFHFFNKIIA